MRNTTQLRQRIRTLLIENNATIEAINKLRREDTLPIINYELLYNLLTPQQPNCETIIEEIEDAKAILDKATKFFRNCKEGQTLSTRLTRETRRRDITDQQRQRRLQDEEVQMPQARVLEAPPRYEVLFPQAQPAQQPPDEQVQPAQQA